MTILFALAVIAFVLIWLNRKGEAPDASASGQFPEESDETDPVALAAPFEALLEASAHPRDLVADPDFASSAARIADSSVPTSQLISYTSGSSEPTSYLAGEALVHWAQREDLGETLLRMLTQRFGWRGWFLLRALHEDAQRSGRPVIGRVLPHLAGFWTTEPDSDWLEGWAEQRRMRLQVLDRHDSPFTALLAISGFAAFPILAPEHGQHVLQAPSHGKAAFSRIRVEVLVAPQPDAPAGTALRAQAVRAIEQCGARSVVVRRYRDEPAPLVRDSARGWRTGNAGQVLAGDFDLFG